MSDPCSPWGVWASFLGDSEELSQMDLHLLATENILMEGIEGMLYEIRGIHGLGPVQEPSNRPTFKAHFTLSRHFEKALSLYCDRIST
jgi:hypothetical protein